MENSFVHALVTGEAAAMTRPCSSPALARLLHTAKALLHFRPQHYINNTVLTKGRLESAKYLPSLEPTEIYHKIQAGRDN